jgi:hypothetical protein
MKIIALVVPQDDLDEAIRIHEEDQNRGLLTPHCKALDALFKELQARVETGIQGDK